MKGDWVRIDNPEMFVRCGYPLSIAVVREQVQKEYGQEIEDFIDRVAFGKHANDNLLVPYHTVFKQGDRLSRSTRQIIDALAYERIKVQEFGGKERKIYTEYAEAMKGKIFKIIGAKTCMTGHYVAPSGGYDGWTGECDYYPGYLDGQKCHRILHLDDEAYGEPCIHFLRDYSVGYRIEDIHVTKIANPKEYIENESKNANCQVAEV